MVGKYKVITLCGSTRFKDAFMEEQKRLTLEGNIVISVGLFGHSGDDEVWTEGIKEMLDDMHKRKIDMADEIFVINVGGYIGSSTQSEIEYATATGKPVNYLEPTDPEYLAGKVRIARWLRLVKKRIQPDIWYVGTRYDGDVRLREITAEDADFMMRLITDRKVTRFIPGMIQDREMLISWIQSLGTTDHEYIVEIEGTDELIGECSLTEQDETGEIGFMLLPKYWHQGYGTEVVNSLIEQALAMKTKELTATTDERNRAAICLLQSCGFKKEKSGWMARLSENENDEAGSGQSIIQFRKTI